LRELRDRAAKKRDTKSTGAVDRALKKIGLLLGEAPETKRELGTPIAQVGTEGGPPLVVPAELLAAWLGSEGPDPYDAGGNNDYERACDANQSSLIPIGKGHGVVLAEQGCDVYAEPSGLLFVASGEPDEEVTKALKSRMTTRRGLASAVLPAAQSAAAVSAKRKALVVIDMAGFLGAWAGRACESSSGAASCRTSFRSCLRTCCSG
jgi:hypothetical protein